MLKRIKRPLQDDYMENNVSEYNNEYVSEYSSKYVSEYTSEYMSTSVNKAAAPTAATAE